ncbi:glycosyltransferase [Mucilaginibacter aquaedulcis]|uniref:glycosyltransferase n=1 Tax=Mucilaginibacter aquaedulcis TaxID=1187081 RepID=UPI0025B3FD2A|nr:glycosyltransferase [Mucilaginibacter aquaedulcis]MDN3548270.1 glycosyltransferase [Mucilaginibacter aquaedulcis]
MSFLLIVVYILELYILIHLLMPFFLFLIGKFNNKKNDAYAPQLREADFGIIVTAYEQIDLLRGVVNSILHLNYRNYLIYIVADNCDISNLKFFDDRVIVLRPETVLASNTKSHFYAIERFKRPHEILTIIDSDNLVHQDYLTELNRMFFQGYQAVQGVREAKNLNSNYACLDAAGDIYYRYIDRELLFNAGSSASLAGSGMAFDVKLYRDCMESMQFSGAGFDKILQYELLKRKLTIAFSQKAIVYDEKTAKSEQLVKQRARWINTWFKFFGLGLGLFAKSIINFNWNQFLFSLMLMRPPLFIMIILSALAFVFNLIFSPLLSIAWVVAGICFIYIFYHSLSYFKADQRIMKSLKSIPKFFFYQVLALTKVFKANKLSVATKHDQDLSIDEFKEQK